MLTINKRTLAFITALCLLISTVTLLVANVGSTLAAPSTTRDAFYSYLDATILSTRGAASMGTRDWPPVSAFQPGVASVLFHDLDKDGEEEMIVLTVQNSLMEPTDQYASRSFGLSFESFKRLQNNEIIQLQYGSFFLNHILNDTDITTHKSRGQVFIKEVGEQCYIGVEQFEDRQTWRGEDEDFYLALYGGQGDDFHQEACYGGRRDDELFYDTYSTQNDVYPYWGRDPAKSVYSSFNAAFKGELARYGFTGDWLGDGPTVDDGPRPGAYTYSSIWDYSATNLKPMSLRESDCTDIFSIAYNAEPGKLTLTDHTNWLASRSDDPDIPLFDKYRRVDGYTSLYEILNADSTLKNPKAYGWVYDIESGRPIMVDIKEKSGKYYAPMADTGVYIAIQGGVTKDDAFDFNDAIWCGPDKTFGTSDDKTAALKTDEKIYYQDDDGVWIYICDLIATARFLHPELGGYVIAYDPDGGIHSPVPQNVVFAENDSAVTVALSSIVPTREGYKFLGWHLYESRYPYNGGFWAWGGPYEDGNSLYQPGDPFACNRDVNGYQASGFAWKFQAIWQEDTPVTPPIGAVVSGIPDDESLDRENRPYYGFSETDKYPGTAYYDPVTSDTVGLFARKASFRVHKPLESVEVKFNKPGVLVESLILKKRMDTTIPALVPGALSNNLLAFDSPVAASEQDEYLLYLRFDPESFLEAENGRYISKNYTVGQLIFHAQDGSEQALDIVVGFFATATPIWKYQSIIRGFDEALLGETFEWEFPALPDGNANYDMDWYYHGAAQTWALKSGTLPGGLALTATGLSGTPNEIGRFQFTLERILETLDWFDAVNGSISSEYPFDIEILSPDAIVRTLTDAKTGLQATGLFGAKTRLSTRSQLEWMEEDHAAALQEAFSDGYGKTADFYEIHFPMDTDEDWAGGPLNKFIGPVTLSFPVPDGADPTKCRLFSLENAPYTQRPAPYVLEYIKTEVPATLNNGRLEIVLNTSSDRESLYVVAEETVSTETPHHQVTYNTTTNGGQALSDTPVQIAEGDPIDLSKTATKPGWEFVGWNTNENASAGLTSLGMGNGNVTLYAIYKKTLTATFIDYSGTTKASRTATVTVYNNETSGSVAAPVQNTFTDWTSRGWSTGTAAIASVAASPLNISADTTFYGLYQRTLTLSYNSNGGGSAPAIQNGTQYVNSYANTALSSVSLSLAPAITRSGYTFSKWAKDSAAGTQYAAEASIDIDKDTTMYALWTASNTYTVRYNANGGTGSMPDSTHIYDQAKLLSANAFSKSGAQFIGWATSAAGAKVYNDQQSVINLTATSGAVVNLYAVWQTITPFSKNDRYSFPHRDMDYNNTYYVSPGDQQKLYDRLTAYHGTLLGANTWNDLRRTWLSPYGLCLEGKYVGWQGSCFGLATTAMLDKLGKVEIRKNYGNNATTLWNVSSPKQNEALRSVVNYYMISQDLSLVYSNYDQRYTGTVTTAMLQDLVNRMQSGQLLQFNFGVENWGGHAVILYGYNGLVDGWHELKAYDCNAPSNETTVVKVKSDYSAAKVDYYSDMPVKSDFAWIEYTQAMNMFDAIDIDGKENKLNVQSDTTQIRLSTKGSITVTDSQGKTLTYNGRTGEITGSMPVLSTHFRMLALETGTSMPQTITIETTTADSYAFDSTTAGMDISVVNSNLFASLSSENAKHVVITENKGIDIAGDSDIHYIASLGLNNTLCDAITFEGNASKLASLTFSGNDVLINGAKGGGKLTVYSNTVDVDVIDFSTDYDKVLVTKTNGKIDVRASTKDNDIYDASVLRNAPSVNGNPGGTTTSSGNVVLTDPSTGVIISAEAGRLPEGTKLVVRKVKDGKVQDDEYAKLFSQGAYAHLYDITLTKDGKQIQPTGSVTVKIPLPGDHATRDYGLYYVNIADNRYQQITPQIEGGSAVFTTDHFSVYGFVSEGTGDSGTGGTVSPSSQGSNSFVNPGGSNSGQSAIPKTGVGVDGKMVALIIVILLDVVFMAWLVLWGKRNHWPKLMRPTMSLQLPELE